MNTAPRIKAGGLPPLQLHRAQPIDFVMSDEEEQEVRNGYDMAMKAALPKRETFQPVEQVADPEEDGPEEMLAAVIVLTIVCLALGSFIAGFLS